MKVNLGRYFNASSFLHRLDPRTKLTALIVYIVSVFLADGPVSCAVSFTVLCLLIWISEVPLKFMLSGFRPVVFIVVSVFLINIFFVKNGIIKASLITLRIIELVLCSNLLTLTTKPKAIAGGIEKGLEGLKVFKIPVRDIAMVISIAFTFIPVLADEAERLVQAQKARGADFESGSLLRRAKTLLPITIPMFVSAFRRSDELALAMESRLYGYAKPGHLNPLRFTSEDAASFLLMFSYFVAIILLQGGLL